jgi:dTMP kinase
MGRIGALPGLFITFEGGEGVGKSTQLKLLSQKLESRQILVRSTREPGSGKLGGKLRDILLRDNLSPSSELLLYLADRAQHIHEQLRPWLQQRQVVLCDRFLDSSEVYQGYARGIGVEFIRGLHNWLGLWPHLTLLLDMPPHEGLQRVKRRLQGNDRLESESISFHEKVRTGFLQQAQAEPQRIKVIDAVGSAAEISERIWQEVYPCVEKWRSADA